MNVNLSVYNMYTKHLPVHVNYGSRKKLLELNEFDEGIAS